jgi:hypothetical protein
MPNIRACALIVIYQIFYQGAVLVVVPGHKSFDLEQVPNRIALVFSLHHQLDVD